MSNIQTAASILHMLKECNLYLDEEGRFHKIENSIHNLGMTPCLVLGKYMVKQVNDYAEKENHHE